MTLRLGLTHPAQTKLTFMDYLLTMLRNLLRRKLSCDIGSIPADRLERSSSYSVQSCSKMDHDGRRRESRRSSISFVRYAATQALMEGQSHGQNFVSPSGDLAKIRRSVKRIRRTLSYSYRALENQ